MDRSRVEENMILYGTTGSRAYGTHTPDSDYDKMGVFVEPKDYVMGLYEIQHSTDKTEGSDNTAYSLRKFVRLAAKGNPTVMELLWLPHYDIKTPVGDIVRNFREYFVSKDSGKRYLGYLHSQKQSLTGQKTHAVKRPDLIERYGYDTKFAMHAVRLGMQGIEFLSEGRIKLPIQGDDLKTLLAIRSGKFSKIEVLEIIDDLEADLNHCIDRCTLKVDTDYINKQLIAAYELHWELQDWKMIDWNINS